MNDLHCVAFILTGGSEVLLAELDANGWSVIIGAIGIIVTNVVTQLLSFLQRRVVAREVKVVKETLVSSNERTSKQLNAVSDKLDDNTTMTGSIVKAADELHKQGNSRWDEIKGELTAARKEIHDLQQLRVDDAKRE